MITVEQYDELIKFAKELQSRYHQGIDPYEMVHTALAINENCTAKDVKSAYWTIRNYSKLFVEYEETPSQIICPVRTRICYKCQDSLPLSAFTYLSRGRLGNTCDRCICAKAADWRKNNPDAAKQNDREQARRHKEHKNAAAKQHYRHNAPTRKAEIKQWQANNPEKVKLIKQKSDKKRREKRRIYLQKWRAANAAKTAAYQDKTNQQRKEKRANAPDQ